MMLANPKDKLPVHPADTEDFFIFASLLLNQLWRSRNLARFEKKIFSFCRTMKQLQFSFAKAKSLATKDHSLRSVRTEKELWTKPPRNFVKINTDAAVKDGTGFVGVVARNDEGKVLSIRSFKTLSDVPEVVEAMVVLQVLLLAAEEGWPSIWCESDSKLVMDNLNNQALHSSHWMAEGILANII